MGCRADESCAAVDFFLFLLSTPECYFGLAKVSSISHLIDVAYQTQLLILSRPFELRSLILTSTYSSPTELLSNILYPSAAMKIIHSLLLLCVTGSVYCGPILSGRQFDEKTTCPYWPGADMKRHG